MLARRSAALALALVLAFAADAFAICKHPPSVLNYTGSHAPPVYGFPVPSTTWGWFGVHYWPTHCSHYGYYGDYRQWGYRQGY